MLLNEVYLMPKGEKVTIELDVKFEGSILQINGKVPVINLIFDTDTARQSVEWKVEGECVNIYLQGAKTSGPSYTDGPAVMGGGGKITLSFLAEYSQTTDGPNKAHLILMAEKNN